MAFDAMDEGSEGGMTPGPSNEINITPFVDVCLVLLIIFMVAAPLAISGVNVTLPKSSGSSLTVSSDALIISINDKGEYHVGKNHVLLPDLVSGIKAASQTQKDPIVYIRADKSVPYARVMDAMAAAQQAGIARIGMMGESAKAAPHK